MRPCLGCGRLAAGSRCANCRRAKEAARPAYRAAYADAEYRRARAVVKATGPACYLCGRLGADSLDHVTPLAAGGLNVPSNWAPAHLSCNIKKGCLNPSNEGHADE